MSKRDFLSLLDFSKDELHYLIERAKQFRVMHENGEVYQPLVGRTAAIIMQLNSTRTRLAFEAGLADSPEVRRALDYFAANAFSEDFLPFALAGKDKDALTQ